jgi:hypothetical protein
VPSRRSLAIDSLRAAAVAAAVLALPAAAPAGERAELVFLAMLLAPALAATALLAPRPAAEFGVGTALCVLAAWSLPAAPTRGAVLVTLATSALVIATARRWRCGPWSLGEWLALTLALQVLARGDLLVQPGFAGGARLRLLAVLILLPALAALAAHLLTALAGGWGLAAAALTFAAQGGLHTANTVALMLLALLVLAARERVAPWLRTRAPAAALGLVAAVVTPLAGYPWLHERPLRAALALPAQALRSARTQDLMARGELVLDGARSTWQQDLAGLPAGEVVVISSLANAAALPPGTEAAAIEAETESGEVLRWTLAAGVDTGEWAARRPDVAAAGPAAPRAWQSMVVRDFFAQRYRAAHRLQPVQRLRRITVARGAGLPPETQLAIFALEVRP